MYVVSNWTEAFYYCLRAEIPFIPNETVWAIDEGIVIVRPFTVVAQ
jgi:hypothetical protein